MREISNDGIGKYPCRVILIEAKFDVLGVQAGQHSTVRPVCASESTAAVAGCSATHNCFGPGRFGRPP